MYVLYDSEGLDKRFMIHIVMNNLNGMRYALYMYFMSSMKCRSFLRLFFKRVLFLWLIVNPARSRFSLSETYVLILPH